MIALGITAIFLAICLFKVLKKRSTGWRVAISATPVVLALAVTVWLAAIGDRPPPGARTVTPEELDAAQRQ